MNSCGQSRYDVVVVGGGHAGCEAALAASRLGSTVALVTFDRNRIAHMSCNPAIGGVGKGHLVREIDALGGAMAQVIDATGIHFRTLNSSRGPAVRSTRAQADSELYRSAMRSRVESDRKIEILEDEVVDLLAERGRLSAVVTAQRGSLRCGSAIITTGTFLNGLCHVGPEQFDGGRIDDRSSSCLADALRRLGIRLGRFKTGTTPRLAADSIAWSELEEQPGDRPPPRFSFDPVPNDLDQVKCHITYTNEATHDIIRNSLDQSPLFQGVIQGLGPRYCPSIEDKVVRFSDRNRHHIFLEPEGLSSNRIYPNGLSTSLPRESQEAFLRTIPGLQEVRVVQHGYAVEYDYAPPTQLGPSLMTKAVVGLFLAGQINGTSGYEEAAAQGLMAGMNAVRFQGGLRSAVLGRDQAYIGVLIDDLVTKGVDEPYRIFTSRAEHRLTLREGNAEARLLDSARDWGLIDADRAGRAEDRQRSRDSLMRLLVETPLGSELAKQIGIAQNQYKSRSRAEILKRPEIRLVDLVKDFDGYARETRFLVEEDIKYAGYIAREMKQIARLHELESVRIPPDMVLDETDGLSEEVREKLGAVRPATLGQASRIPGVTPAALAVLRLNLWRRQKGKQASSSRVEA